MGRQDERYAPLLQSVQAVPQQVAGLRVEARGWLVEKEQLRLVDQRAGDRQTPLHAPRQRLDLVVLALGELGKVEELVGATAALVSRQAEVAAVQDEVLADGQLRVKRVLLRHDAETRPDLGAVDSGVEAENGQRPLADR